MIGSHISKVRRGSAGSRIATPRSGIATSPDDGATVGNRRAQAQDMPGNKGIGPVAIFDGYRALIHRDRGNMGSRQRWRSSQIGEASGPRVVRCIFIGNRGLELL